MDVSSSAPTISLYRSIPIGLHYLLKQTWSYGNLSHPVPTGLYSTYNLGIRNFNYVMHRSIHQLPLLYRNLKYFGGNISKSPNKFGKCFVVGSTSLKK